MKKNPYVLFFKALSNATRVGIIESLRGGPLNVSGICAATGFEQSRVSHNLGILEAWEFISCVRDGKNRVYSLDKRHMQPLLKLVDRYLEKNGEKLDSCGILAGKRTCVHCGGKK